MEMKIINFMNKFEAVLFLILVLMALTTMASPIYVLGYAKPADPYWFTMDFDPQIIQPYDPVSAVGTISYVFLIPVPLEYRLELDIKAFEPWSITYYDLPPYTFKKGDPRWVNEAKVYYYTSGMIWRQGSGELWISFRTSTAYFYDYHWGAVGDSLAWWPENDVSYFVAEPLR